jgi:hypothetical protein
MRTDGMKLVEYMITDATSKSNLPKVQRNPYDLTRHFEAKKADKYRALAAKMDAQVVPFVVEAHGGLGESAREFVKELAAFALSRRATWSPRNIREGLLDEIAIAVARRNAKMVTAGISLRGNKYAYSLA